MKMTSISVKTGSWHKHKKGNGNNNRFLITINVLGSAGPIRFVVNRDDSARVVIETALKIYAREERLPVLGSDVNNFFLYPAHAGLDAVEPWEAIGSREAYRNFVMCQKQMTQGRSEVRVTSGGKRRRGWGWGSWIRKSLSLKIMPH